MLLRQITLLSAPLLLAGCATAAVPRSVAALPTVYERGIVSAADPRAAEAGTETLRAGGSAVDAALATLLALTVVEPQSSGIGGGGFLLTDDGRGGVESFDGRETAPSAATPDWFLSGGQYLAQPQAVPGGVSVGVPGNVALIAEAHRRHGKLAWAKLFDPAIRLATAGFAITPRFRQFLDRNRRTGAFSAEARKLYYDTKGEPLAVGTVVRNPALARFLGEIAKRGPEAFYRGGHAQAIAGAVSGAERRPAAMNVEDFAGYRAKRRAPVCGTYRRHRVCGMGPPSSGATTVLSVLGLLERFDLKSLGRDGVTSWHLMAEAQRLAYADRERYLADADFVSVPVAGLLAPDYIAARARLIAPDRAMSAVAPGSPTGAKTAQADALTVEVPSTSHFVAVDRQGRAATLTSTIEGPFGSGLMVNGYYLNNELTDFSMIPERGGNPVANRVQPGKRPLSSMSPTLVYAPDGKLRLAIGAAGGKTIPAQVAKAIVGVIDWGLTAQEAIALPLIYAPGGNTVVVEQGSRLEALVPALSALGHPEVRAAGLPLKANAVEAIEGALSGGADPRSEGTVILE